LLIRRAEGDHAEVRGALYASRWEERSLRWHRIPYRATLDGKIATDTKLKSRWLGALADQFKGRTHPWYQFSSGRVQTLLPNDSSAASSTQNFNAEGRNTELSRLMETTTGVMSMQEALQHDRGLRLDRAPVNRSIQVSTLSLPELEAHPFAAMQSQLPSPQAGVAEPMAKAVPAEFWYARVDDIRLLLRLLDEADAWITPVVQILDRSPEDRKLADRYQTQLGLSHSGLAKLFGNVVLGEVALTGSDPYLREGSDLTIIFKVKQQSTFDAELSRHLARHAERLGPLEQSSRNYHGVSISMHHDAGGQVRQQRAQIEDLAIVSNSTHALNRVIDAIQGRAARLSDEPDLQYMLARDPGQHQAFAFLSDKFIAATIGPQQKILAARRQQALAELLTPGYTALLHGWLFGAAPSSTEALIKSGLLTADDLRHEDGNAIQFAPGTPAQSSWGTVSALTPLIDLPPVSLISVEEKTAYEQFVSTYQQYWKQFIDPVAIRLDLNEGDNQTTATLDVRILPLISGTDYSSIQDVVGNTRIEVNSKGDGVQATWAVGAQAALRRDLDRTMRSATGQTEVGLGWLGDWVALGLQDRASLMALMSWLDDSVQLPAANANSDRFNDLELWQRVGKFPIYAAAEVKNPAILIATLAAVRTMLGQVAPGWIDWGEAGTYRDLHIVRIGVSKSAQGLPNPAIADALALHYAQTGKAFVVALNLDTLHHAIDLMLDEAAPKAAAKASAQLVYETRSQAGAPLWTALLWLLQGQAYEAQLSARQSAEVLLRSDRSLAADREAFSALGLAYLGFVPLNARGNHEFVLLPEGAGDSTSGSTITPRFSTLPIPGSPIEKLMQRLTGVRGEISFDEEPRAAGEAARSLHTRFTLQLGPETKR
jgi:hypothetical protein